MGEPGPTQRLRRGGRPRKTAGELRTFRLSAVRLTEAEAAFVTEQAARAGLLLAPYIRQLATGHSVQPATTAADDALLLELNRIGVNLNQIARSLNSDRPEHADLSAAIEELRRVLSTLAAAV